jgi:soluble lytic murein transglycosylase
MADGRGSRKPPRARLHSSRELRRRLASGNHDQMGVSHLPEAVRDHGRKAPRRAASILLILAIVAAGCATTVVKSPAARAGQNAAPTPPAAPVESEPAPADARQAFVEGYRALRAHDTQQAIAQLSYAADHYPTLADYATFYLGQARHQAGDLAGAAAAFERLRREYPESVMTPLGELELARVLLAMGRNAEAAAASAHLASVAHDPEIEQNARLVEARALLGEGDTATAYSVAMALREQYPRSDADAQARELARTIITANPAVAPSTSLDYRRREADLLLREAQPALALVQARSALAQSPPDAVRAELLWIVARAEHASPAREKRALLEYLSTAPRGPAAPAVLYHLALIYWNENALDRARATFAHVAAGFPSSEYAPGAMLRIGRIYEEQHRYDSARAEYLRAVARYHRGPSAAEARFRAPWTYFMAGHFESAAAMFASMKPRAADPSERDMFEYWRARSMEKSGNRAGARAIYERLAQSIDSNYYPALASSRTRTMRPDLPAASAPDPSLYPAPSAGSPAARFHLSRALALKSLGLTDLEPAELRALEGTAGSDPRMRSFVLAAFQSADAWHDAIVAASRMAKQGRLSEAVAERVRYPRAYWNMFDEASRKHALDPYLVLALARQESLFDPRATSVSNAKGLMQLMPATARKVARESGMPAGSLDLYDPELNVALGTVYLRNLFAMFGGNEFKAVAAYNGGEHAVEQWNRKFPGADDEWVENITYRETREYVKKVIGGWREYQLLYGQKSRLSMLGSAARSPE